MNPEWVSKYEESLRNHLRYFREAARSLGVSADQIGEHDLSKYSKEEYPFYVARFGGDAKSDNDVPGFDGAWLHHIRNNPHHWQYWLIPGGHGNVNLAVEMPDVYAAEMVADWMGSGKAYTGSWDMTVWLKKNIRKVHIHRKTREFVYSLLSRLGYNMNDIFMESLRPGDGE